MTKCNNLIPHPLKISVSIIQLNFSVRTYETHVDWFVDCDSIHDYLLQTISQTETVNFH